MHEGNRFSSKLLEKAYFIFKMTGAAMVQPASSDFWKAPLVYQRGTEYRALAKSTALEVCKRYPKLKIAIKAKTSVSVKENIHCLRLAIQQLARASRFSCTFLCSHCMTTT